MEMAISWDYGMKTQLGFSPVKLGDVLLGLKNAT